MKFLVTIVALTVACTHALESYPPVTQAVYNSLEKMLMETYKNFNRTDVADGNKLKYDIMPSVVRLGFHTCVGGCDGCINLNDANNYGLQHAISPLEQVYKMFNKNMSRADFWAFAMIIACKFACTTAGGMNYVPNFGLEYGRVDCPTTPQATSFYEYPNPFMTTEQVTDYYYRTMGLSPREVVALLGAHTLGGGHKEGSGFHGDWDDMYNKLDNGYFSDMIDIDWKMDTCAFPGFPNQVYQWVHDDGSYFMMDTDIALYKNIGPIRSDGYVTCKYADCPLASTAKVVEMYAQNNTLFLDDFAAVVTKMLRHGQGPLKPVGK